VVAAAEDAGAFEGEDFGGLLDDADEGGIAGGVGAELAKRLGGEEAAAGAGADGRGDFADGAGNLPRAGVARLDHPEGDALGAAGADAGHALQLGDESADGGGVFGTLHGWEIRNPKIEIRNKSEGMEMEKTGDGLLRGRSRLMLSDIWKMVSDFEFRISEFTRSSASNRP